MKGQPKKAPYYMIISVWHSEKGKTLETGKKNHWLPAIGEVGERIGQAW